MNGVPIVKDVCLVGGGHSHALLLRRWAMHPIPGVRLTLVSSTVQTPYSGMLPGLIAGHYSYDDIHIDLLRLCTWANVRFIEDTIVAIDLDARHVQFAHRPHLSFDVLSLDTGSTPDLSVPGSAQHVIPVKPVSNFHARWTQLKQRLETVKGASVSIGVIGSGAGGFELVTAMKHQLRNTAATCHWFLRGDDSIAGRPDKVGQYAEAAAEAAGINVVRGFDVVEVKAGQLLSADGRTATLDEIIWCTAATGPDWPTSAGLDVDTRGFVATNAYLQSTSHDFVFATGDIGTQVETPSNKAGVFAVRQAPVLFKNLRAYLLGDSLSRYTPQKDFLSLMATGPKHGIASRGPLAVRGDWVWRWKDHIDQTFMDRFRDLPVLSMNASLAKLPDALLNGDAIGTSSTTSINTSISTLAESPLASSVNAMRCKGCGAKVGQGSLQRVLDELLPATHDNAAVWSPAGDTAIVNLPARTLVQSVDQINAIVDDPYVLGRIAALHAISDVFTQNAILHSAQILLSLPEASPDIVERDLRLVMQGVLSVLEEESCALIGGHTTQGPDMSVGLAINATMQEPVKDDQAIALPSVRAGDALILTKAIGVGTLFAGLMQGTTHGAHATAAIASMLTSNRRGAELLRQHGSVAMTDITGFGLLGHLTRLLQGLKFDAPGEESALLAGAMLSVADTPFLAGALELSRRGCRSSLWSENSSVLKSSIIADDVEQAAAALLVDPQTSGGLLAALPASSVSACLASLQEAGYIDATCVGHIQSGTTIDIVNSC